MILKHRGNNVHCPCCNRKFSSFLTFGLINERPNAQCAGCGSLERHRLMFLYLKNKTEVFNQSLSVLHFAPEPSLYKYLSDLKNIRYIPCDKLGLGYNYPKNTVEIDIHSINLPNKHVDIILCSHVLEHVDDKKAIKEFYRILKPGGIAFIQIPIDYSKKETFEDKKITTPEERVKFFGQEDHLRLYGQDIKKRFSFVPFLIEQVNYLENLSLFEINNYGLQREDIIIFSKPH